MTTIYLVTMYLASPIENAIIFYFLIRNFGFKDEKLWRKWVSLLVYTFVIIIAHFINKIPNGDIILSIFVIGVYWIYSRVILNGKAIMQLLCCFTVFLFLILINTLTFQLVGMTTHIDVEKLMHNEDLLKVWIFVLSKVLLFICVEILLYILKRNQINLRKKEWVTLIFVFTVSVVISCSIYTLVISNPNNKGTNINLIIVLIGIFILNIFIYHSILKISRDNQRILETKLADLQRQEVANQLLQISEAEDNESKMRHDYKNHLMCLLELMQQSKSKEATNYLQNITENYVSNSVSKRVCNNTIINAVVNNKIRICNKTGINWKHSVTGDTSKLDGVACSIILFNLLDNAIEANANLTDKQISLSMYFNKKYFNIVVRNPIKESVLNNNPSLQSSKNKGRHGLGHLNVEDVVNKNGGMVDYYEKDNQFVAHILLKV